MTQDKRKLIIPLVAFFFVSVALIILAVVWRGNQAPDNQIVIENYTTYVKNIGSSERGSIQENLFTTVNMNLEKPLETGKKTRAIIRDGSYEQSLEDGIYTTNFIVDVESLKQSFSVINRYATKGSGVTGLDYTARILCLSKSKLIYDDFSCRDVVSSESGLSVSDPLLQYLPYSTLDYNVSSVVKDEKLVVVVSILLSEADYRTGVDAAITQRKAEIKKWFEKNGLSVDDYTFEYKY